MSHTLRQFHKEDAGGVRDLILSILTKEYPFDKGAYSESDLDRIGEVYGGGRDSFFVIEDANRVVGTVGIKEETKDEALLRRLFVDPGYRKHGYGQALLTRAVEFCKEKRYHRVYFRCTDRMGDAMRLCVKNGFREVESLEVGGFHIHKLELGIK